MDDVKPNAAAGEAVKDRPLHGACTRYEYVRAALQLVQRVGAWHCTHSAPERAESPAAPLAALGGRSSF